jgi:hypothetical protein
MSKKSEKILSLYEVYALKREGNPDKPFAPGVLNADLGDRSYQEIVEIFEDRINRWYFNVAEEIQEKIADYNFAVVILCSTILDLMSQYVYAVPVSGESVFKKFFREYLGEYNYEICPPISSCYFNKRRKKWLKETIKDVADGFYHCFRCGVVHSAGIMEYGRISTRYTGEMIRVVEWAEGKQEINVNPVELLRKLKCIFADYIRRLKEEEFLPKKNFIEKFRLEYGVQIPE